MQDPIANEGVIEDSAVDALKEMSTFLTTAKTMHIVSNGSMDVVTNNGQRIQLDGRTTYKVRKPNGFVIDYESGLATSVHRTERDNQLTCRVTQWPAKSVLS